MSASHAKKMNASLTPAEVASRDRRIARAVRDGISMQEVKRRFGLDHRDIRRICLDHGVEPGKRGSGR